MGSSLLVIYHIINSFLKFSRDFYSLKKLIYNTKHYLETYHHYTTA